MWASISSDRNVERNIIHDSIHLSCSFPSQNCYKVFYLRKWLKVFQYDPIYFSLVFDTRISKSPQPFNICLL